MTSNRLKSASSGPKQRTVDPAAEAAAAAALLPHLPKAEILARYRAANGNEIASGKLASERSSAALAANTFGFFINRPTDLPPLPDWVGAWRPSSVLPEVELPFPWRGGLHPWLDAVIETGTHLIGVESKRYEPWDSHSWGKTSAFSEAYWRDKWGKEMHPYQWVRDGLTHRPGLFRFVNAAQFVKHAFGLRTQAGKKGKAPVLTYVYAEPKAWPAPNGKTIPESERAAHAEEVRWFARMVESAEVAFRALTYAELLATFAGAPSQDVRDHAVRLREHFDIG